ncbi:hypothetical protein BJ980_002269 [Nocardioides daedukensis]|uniref:ADP-ribosyl cyclase/cyclic ADP-ribose hydrolase n=1 Tax=Nocardioides daedukensis TaxID=634462 RepID=A0A7Y9RZ66_9ACTN|nr:DUF1883 domain-containing protein [Nocardioides daedukensis]NYG59346.1 hypothetical protein [Nocardioides daedukensis]
MQHLYFDLKQQKKGAVAVVTLDKQANVRLMTASNYGALKSGRRFSFHGGRATKSPVRLPIPSNGHWFVVVDLGGLAGRVRASVAVQPPPPGMLAPIRDRGPINDVQVREPIEPDGDALGGQTWDVFISHASEDKEAVAVPLRNALVDLGISVWLDKTELTIGDSLRRKIDQGIRSSRFGIVVLSERFFDKGWTNHELDGLVTRTVAGEQTLLPIWHNLTCDQVRAYSPSLADKVALTTDTVAIEDMAEQIAGVVRGRGEDVA